MKKFIAIFIFIVVAITSVFLFINSTYFFNRYIANTITEYGFSYDRVNGALLRGFNVDNLKYKGELLSSNVELKFNPLKLIQKRVSINKLRLIAVRKKVLEKLINDFKPSEDNSSNREIVLNFEFKDILLTIKPFEIDSIRVIKNALSVDYVEYIDGKFNIGNVDYQAKTDIGNVEFSGKYEKRVLYIDSIDLVNFNINRFIPILKELQNQDSDSNSSDIPNPFIPKVVKVKEANLNLSPFKIEDISSKDLKITIKNGLFNVEKVKLKKANIALKYSSNLANLKADINYKNRKLQVDKLNVNILNLNEIEKIYSKLDTNSSNSNKESLTILDIDSIEIVKSNIDIDKFNYKKEKINSINVATNGINILLNKNRVLANNLKLDINSSILNGNIEAKIDKEIDFNNITLYSNNIDKLISILDSNSSNDSNTTNIAFIPNKFLIRKASIKGDKLSFNPFLIDKANIAAKNIKGDINRFNLHSGELKASVVSNWGRANLDGLIKNNNYYAKGLYRAKQALLKEYSIPLIAKHLKPLKVDGRFGFEDLDINISLQGKDILQNIKDIDILSSQNRLKVNYSSGDTYWNIKADIDSTYTGRAKLVNRLTYYDKLIYYGKLTPNKINISKELDTLLKGLSTNYKGDSNSIDVKFASKKLKGRLLSKDYKKAILTVETKEELLFKEFFNVSKDLANAKIKKLFIKSPIDFNKILPLKGEAKIATNLLNLKGDWSYNKSFKSKLKSTLAKNSLIIKRFKNLNKSLFNGLNIELEATKKKLNTKLFNKLLTINSLYNYSNKKLKIDAKSNSLKVNCTGDINKLNISFNSNSIGRTIKDLSTIYKIKNLPKLEGSLKLTAQVTNLKDIKIKATAPKVLYKDKKSTTKIENISINTIYNNNRLQIVSYNLEYNNYKFYSNKSSTIDIKDNSINIKPLWINNTLKVDGLYNIDKSIGKLKLKSSNFSIENSDVKLKLSLDNKIDIIKQKVAIIGKITILNGVIKKNLKQKSVADNEDIIILQRQAAKKSTNFAKNIKLSLQIFSKNGILYKHDGSHFVLQPDLTIKKEFNRLSKFKGKIYIKKGGYYILNGKKLILQKGVILFKGRSSTPNINIVMFYKGREYDITINISGTPTRPILYFSSNPPLAKDQILAYILFDDSTAAGTHSQESMLNLIGGTLAKSFLGSIGIKIDQISIKENGFTIGKSIGDHIMIYYNQDGEKASVKTRVDITKSIHTEIEVKEDSQSADIIFSKEY